MRAPVIHTLKDRRTTLLHPLLWLGRRDPDLAASRRAGRAAIVMPAMFAVGEKVIDDPALAIFAALGSFAMLLLVDFGGPMRERLQAQLALGFVGCVFVCLGTLVSQTVWVAAVTTALVGFLVIFAGVLSSVLAGATTSLLLAFILPATISGAVSSVPDRVAGWAMAAAASLVAVALLWPAPSRSRLRTAATTACRALAVHLRTEVAYLASHEDESLAPARDRALAHANDAVLALHRGFLATPYPPSVSTAARAMVHLIDELSWLNALSLAPARPVTGVPLDRAACAVKHAAAAVLERGADLLEATGGDREDLHVALAELTVAVRSLEESATSELPIRRAPAGSSAGAVEEQVSELITSLDPSFRAQELGFAVSLIGDNIDLVAAAERRGWLARVLGHRSEGTAGTLVAVQARANAHIDRRSVWLHNSVRGAVALGVAVLVANRTGVQHSFWVVLGTLSVLRSNALSTGQNVLRALLGTVAGFIVGAALLALIGTNTTLLWLLLAPAILLAGVAPAAISFTAGQAAFTLTLVFLFNILQPAGWHVGLLRVEDVAIGCAVSLVVGVLFWPRGARAALRRALADAYSETADYLASAVDFGMLCCEPSASSPTAPEAGAARAAAAAQRLDDTFRSYLAERGAKPVTLAQVTSLVTGVGGVRLAGDAVLDLWQREDGPATGDRAAARQELLKTSELVKAWYEDLAHSLLSGAEPRKPLPHDEAADGRLLDALRRDLRGEDGGASATAVRMIWTGEHLDAVRRLQRVILEPARATSGR